MAVDQELQRHVEMWHSFTRITKWGVAFVVILLLVLAAALL